MSAPDRPVDRFDWRCAVGHTQGWIAHWNTKQGKYLWTCRGCKQDRVKRWKESLRPAALAHYGGQCTCCSERYIPFLVIDHIDGGGAQHRAALRNSGGIYAWLKRQGYPEGFQVLCANCNTAKEYGGCPDDGHHTLV